MQANPPVVLTLASRRVIKSSCEGATKDSDNGKGGWSLPTVFFSFPVFLKQFFIPLFEGSQRRLGLLRIGFLKWLTTHNAVLPVCG
jgi:hypothetical protein